MGTITISGNSENIYGDLAGANAYFSLSIRSTNWDTGTSTTKQKALVSATRWMDRVGLVDSNGDTLAPVSDDTGIDTAVQQGCYELAAYLLGDSTAADQSDTGSNVKVAKAGSASVEFFRPESGSIFPEAALRLLAPYLAPTISSSTGMASYGGTVDDSSVFDADDQLGFGLNTGGYP